MFWCLDYIPDYPGWAAAVLIWCMVIVQELIRNRTHMQQLTNKWYEEVRGRPSASEDETEI